MNEFENYADTISSIKGGWKVECIVADNPQYIANKLSEFLSNKWEICQNIVCNDGIYTVFVKKWTFKE